MFLTIFSVTLKVCDFFFGKQVFVRIVSLTRRLTEVTPSLTTIPGPAPNCHLVTWLLTD